MNGEDPLAPSLPRLRARRVGWRDAEAKLAIEGDALFRIASMTKPVTSTAASVVYRNPPWISLF